MSYVGCAAALESECDFLRNMYVAHLLHGTLAGACSFFARGSGLGWRETVNRKKSCVRAVRAVTTTAQKMRNMGKEREKL